MMFAELKNLLGMLTERASCPIDSECIRIARQELDELERRIDKLAQSITAMNDLAQTDGNPEHSPDKKCPDWWTTSLFDIRQLLKTQTMSDRYRIGVERVLEIIEGHQKRGSKR